MMRGIIVQRGLAIDIHYAHILGATAKTLKLWLKNSTVKTKRQYIFAPANVWNCTMTDAIMRELTP